MKHWSKVFFVALVFIMGLLEWSYCADKTMRHYSANEAKQESGFSNQDEMEFIGAASSGNMEAVRNLLAKGVNVNGKYGIMQQTALDTAANHGRLAMVKFLVDSGADVNNRGTLGWPPLMHAANNCHLEVVKYLIGHGADVNATDHDGFTILQQTRCPEVVKVLKDAGAKE